jgi:UDP-N-acetylmuramoylalanine--D-glutamate ligase
MAESHYYGIVGLGATGFSCARFLAQQNIPFVIFDTREAPPQLKAFRESFPEVTVYTGNDWPRGVLRSLKVCVVSPGVNVTHPQLQFAKAQGVEIIGDVELFARFNTKPIIAITGANGKSTVTTLVGEMALADGKKVAVVGNIGTPVLEIFKQGAIEPDLIVMELSSFQLETTSSLQPIAATVLNVTPDHMDRYANFNEYKAAKHRIYHQARNVIINLEDPSSDSPAIPHDAKRWYFTTQVVPQSKDDNIFSVRHIDGKRWLTQGSIPLVPVDHLKIQGEHNVGNALSALALGSAAGLSMEAMLQALQSFTGLEHRCQWVAQVNDICWINDSKGTNIGACEAALKGLGAGLKGKIVLLLGGDGKGADFSPLAGWIKQFCRAIIVMGKDAPLITAALAENAETFSANNMAQAVMIAHNCAQAGDVVLLSPACSSLDQYRDYTHRGEIFMDEVRKVLKLNAYSA